jgi:hypothetical protein
VSAELPHRYEFKSTPGRVAVMAFVETQAEAAWLAQALLQVASYLPTDEAEALGHGTPHSPSTGDNS